MSIKITIPLPPVTKKNSQRIMHSSKTGKSFIMPSQKYIDYEAKAVWYCKKAGVHEPIDYPVEVKCLFYMPTRRRVDLTNLLDDHCGIIVSHDGSRVLYDKENPRTEVSITAYE